MYSPGRQPGFGVGAGRIPGHAGGMTDWTPVAAPSLDDFARLAEAALQALPAHFRKMAGDVEMRVAEFAEDAVLDDLGIEDAFDLTGLYHGVDLARRSTFGAPPGPS